MLSHVFLKACVLCIVLAPLGGVAQAARELDKSLSWPGQTLLGNPCYGDGIGFGPFDYADKKNWTGDRLFIVERRHFPPESEHLTGTGSVLNSTDTEYALGGDFDYTLRAFPNHHRALWSKVLLHLQNRNRRTDEERSQREREKKKWPPPECYLQRARVFAPEDPVPLMIFGIYLHRSGRHEQAIEMYREAEKKMPEHAELTYNIGLLLYDMGDSDSAKIYADKAKALGYPLTGLERKLRQR